MNRSDKSGLGVEVLENRLLMDGNVSVGFRSGLLVVSGDTLDNQVEISQPTPGTIRVEGLDGTTVNGREFMDVTGSVRNLSIQLRQGGADQLAIMGPIATAADLRAKMGDGELTIEGSDGPVEVGRDLTVRAGASANVTMINEVLQAVHRQANQLRHILEMLLFLARADSQAKLPQLEVIDLSAWLAEHSQAWSDLKRAAELRIEFPADEPLCIEAQAPLLGQMLDNLLDNAFKYSESGSPVTLRFQADPDTISITVEDAGPGIPADDLPHVFEPFYRSPDARRRGTAGAGLGLAVAQRIAAAFGGLIRAESIAQQGSRFTITLRRVRTNESSQPVAEHAGLGSPEMATENP